jgi:hypothetical protein
MSVLFNKHIYVINNYINHSTFTSQVGSKIYATSFFMLHMGSKIHAAFGVDKKMYFI